MADQIQTVKAYHRSYKVYNGTYYHLDTSDEMVRLLDKILVNQDRVRFHWGDAKTGLDWGEYMNCTGKIGRSTGPVKIPILLYNKRSIGGHAILTDCIVKISLTRGGKILYQHPNYHPSLEMLL